jgi:hypothetical protein
MVRYHVVVAQATALPGGLGRITDTLPFIHKKGDDALMKRMARPRPFRSGDAPGKFYFNDNPEDFHRLCEYCVKDVLAERELYQWIQRHWDRVNSINCDLSKPRMSAA